MFLQSLGCKAKPFDHSSSSNTMAKFTIVAVLLLICSFSKSEKIRKFKTVPLSDKTCPCWWDLEGKLIDPLTQQPFKVSLILFYFLYQNIFWPSSSALAVEMGAGNVVIPCMNGALMTEKPEEDVKVKLAQRVLVFIKFVIFHRNCKLGIYIV